MKMSSLVNIIHPKSSWNDDFHLTEQGKSVIFLEAEFVDEKHEIAKARQSFHFKVHCAFNL